MKQMAGIRNRRFLKTVITAVLVLTPALFLSGCSVTEHAEGPRTEEADGIRPEDTGSAHPEPAEGTGPEDTDGADSSPEESQADDEKEQLFDGPILSEGFLSGESMEISGEESEKLRLSVKEMEFAYRSGPGGPPVESRDFGSYTSSLARSGLSSVQVEFYDRLDQLFQRYIRDSSLDGVEYMEKQKAFYLADNVFYSDLGLTAREAADILWWFKYNNPQYYFAATKCFYTEDVLIPTIYEFAADGEERVKLTNELFDKLDGWIASIDSGGETTWQKELSANNLLCRELVYDSDLAASDDQETIWKGQTLYTAVMSGDTVCAGYAQAFCAMMNASGVETVVALSSNHAWNVSSYDDGNCYATDVCWNDNDEDDDNPYNRYINVGEATLNASAAEKESHVYSDTTRSWTPKIARSDCASADGPVRMTPLQEPPQGEDGPDSP